MRSVTEVKASRLWGELDGASVSWLSRGPNS